MAIEMSIKLSTKQAGKLYQKTMRLEEENEKLDASLKEAMTERDELLRVITNTLTTVGNEIITASDAYWSLCDEHVPDGGGLSDFIAATIKERDVFAKTVSKMISYINDDALAASFQTTGQYRSALIKMLANNSPD